ncbi:VTT domain-containing protein [Peptococcaceae bacterium]|nr:VTT domain-containing protein [Peptococcaceae bacterium]
MDWLKDVFDDYGLIGLLILAVLDSFILSIPTEALFIPLGLANCSNVFLYASLTAAAGALGAVFGYVLGLKGGRPILNRFFDNRQIYKVERLFSKHGSLAVVVAAFSPVPFQLATIASGVFRMSLIKLIICAFIGRFARFGLLAVIIVLMGEKARDFLTSPEFLYLLVLITIIGLVLYGLYWVLKGLFAKKE